DAGAHGPLGRAGAGPRPARGGGRPVGPQGPGPGPHPDRPARPPVTPQDRRDHGRGSKARRVSSRGGAPSRLSTSKWGTAGGRSGGIAARNVSHSASFWPSRGEPRAVRRARRVAGSERTQTRRTGSPPSASTND